MKPLVALACLTVVALFALAAVELVAALRVVAPSPALTCVEDMPCWDCKTMGNRICGRP